MTAPVSNFGVKNVDFGGISNPSVAVRRISITETGRMSTAATARALVTMSKANETPCW